MIGKQTRFRPCPFRLAAMLVLLLVPGFAHAETTSRALENALALRHIPQPAGTDALYAFYARRNFQPAWSGSRQAEVAAALAVKTLQQSDTQGLEPDDYGTTELSWQALPLPGMSAAAYDLSLTGKLLAYAHDVRQGRVDPSSVYADVALPPSVFDAGAALNKALAEGRLGDFLDGLPPPHPEYRNLVLALARYRALQAAGGWSPLPDRNASPQALMRRLALEDPGLAMTGDSAEGLRQAVMRFQTRNGLAADGRIGAATLAALNIPVESRIGQIIASMERWRWLPRQFEPRTVRVNVPDQQVRYYRGDDAVLVSRVAVGKIASKTPIARVIGTSLVANPPWEVPDDIAAASILPKLRQDPSYLVDHNMVLVDGPPDDPQGLTIDWRQLKTLPYHIDQNPGEGSAMGTEMLDAPNRFGVYLHDTPGKRVFAAASRQASNGCIRVQDMAELSALLLSDGEETRMEMLDQAISSGETERLALARPVPVYLLYWTAIADADGNAGFRSDFYGRDAKLLAALHRETFPLN
jgi:murein L,D-transpeptidase YcbB/YkuD